MTDAERAIYDAFTNEDYVSRLLDYMSLEEQKGKDKFHPDHFQLFKVSCKVTQSALTLYWPYLC